MAPSKTPVPNAPHPTRIWQEGSAVMVEVTDALLGTVQHTTVQEAVNDAMSRFRRGTLPAEDLAAFNKALYSLYIDIIGGCNAQVAWIAAQEERASHWKNLGFESFQEYLHSIDGEGKVQAMVQSHRDTLKRKSSSSAQIEAAWPGCKELTKLVAKKEGEDRWRRLAQLANQTLGMPEVAKWCLNTVLLERVRSNKFGRSAQRSFIGLDFEKAAKLAESLEWRQHPWENASYEGLEELGLKLYKGIVMSVHRFPGLIDQPPQNRLRTLSATPVPATTASAPPATALADAPTSAPPNVLVTTSANALASDPAASTPANAPASASADAPANALVTTSANALASAPPNALAIASANALASAPPNALASAPNALATTSANVLASAPADEEAESAATSDAKSDASAPASDAESGALDVGPEADPDESGIDSPALDQLMEELSKGQAAKWKSTEEIVVEGGLDWLLSDVEVATILKRERLMYVEHFGREPLEVRMSLANQALRQDPALYALAVCCISSGNTRLITSPIDDNHAALCAEAQLSASKGDVKFRRAMAPARTSHRLVISWAQVSEDGTRLLPPSSKSWALYSVVHAVGGSEAREMPTLVRLGSVCNLGAALIGQQIWTDPSVQFESSVVLGKDRHAAFSFIENTRRRILEEIKYAFSTLVKTERFYYGERSFFLKQERAAGLKRALVPATNPEERDGNGNRQKRARSQ